MKAYSQAGVMVRRKFAIFMILVAAALISAGDSGLAAQKTIPLAGDTVRAAAVWQSFEAWLKAYEAADLKGTMDIFDRSVNFAFQGGPDQTYADLEASYVSDFKTRPPGTVWSPEIAEVYADDSLAFVRSVWELHVTQSDGSIKTTARNRSIDVFHLMPDGKWRIFRSLNYPEKA
jgi:ketosteroid isomerase-like protein